MFDGEKRSRHVGWNRLQQTFVHSFIPFIHYTRTSNDSDVALSPSYLHRHSRQTRLKLILPFASGTSPSAIFNADDVEVEDVVEMVGAKAEVVEAAAATRMDGRKNFMFAGSILLSVLYRYDMLL